MYYKTCIDENAGNYNPAIPFVFKLPPPTTTSSRSVLNQIATWNGGMLRPEDLMGAIQAKMAKKEAVFADLLGE